MKKLIFLIFLSCFLTGGVFVFRKNSSIKPVLAQSGEVINGWSVTRGQFQGHGSGLNALETSIDNKNVIWLTAGDTDAHLKVGYVQLAKNFSPTVGDSTFVLNYKITTYDTIFGPKNSRYFDSVEFSLNKPIDQIRDAERNAQGCKIDAQVNPDNVTFTPTGAGLLFCGGSIPANSNKIFYDSNWRTVSLDLSSFLNQTVSIYIGLWGREHDDPFYNDQGYYATQAYIEESAPAPTVTPSPTSTPIPTPTPVCRRETADVVVSNGAIDAADIQFILDNWMSADVAADINKDFLVNSFDYECVYRFFGK